MELWATILLWMMLFSAACNFWSIVQSANRSGIKDTTAISLALDVGLVVWGFSAGVTLW